MSPRGAKAYDQHLNPQHALPQSWTNLPLRSSLDAMEYFDRPTQASLTHTVYTRSTHGGRQEDNETATTATCVDEDDDEAEDATPKDSCWDALSINSPSPRFMLDSDGADVQDIGQWYFVTQMPEQDLQYFRSAQNHWVKGIWEMARVNQPMYAAMGSFALHKKAVLSSSQSNAQYYEQKGRMIRDIIANLNTPSDGNQGPVNPLTIAAIAILGYLDIRDAQYDSASTHLRAVCKFIDMPRLPTHAWLYCVWVDLRFALFTGQEPRLPFYIPAAYRDLPRAASSCKNEATRLGRINASECPRSPLFTLEMARDLFCKLHALCACADTLAPTDDPPFGQIYALEYGLRVLQARTGQSQGDLFMSNVVALLTSAIQLHVWMASRFWTPQRRESHFALIVRACKVIESFDDMVTQWYISAGLESLLWVLFTFVAALRAHEHPDTASTLELLYKAIKKAQISTCDDFGVRLHKWPWLKNWHPVQIKAIWAMLCDSHGDLVPLKSEAGVYERPPDPYKTRNRWFVGGLEFFNSL